MLPVKLHEIRNALPDAPMLIPLVMCVALNALVALLVLGAVTGVFYLIGFDVLWLLKGLGLAALLCTFAIIVAVRINRFLVMRAKLGRTED